ncbi:hypothetical protein ASG01_01300 [Chryseobacterium sp. Leaf180]|uniref:hypothetical protein n=1 Tax=Chryseobacterium sp. Leaf180 TaxID=1736289 RepID=UPI0006F8EBD5|nr:hypothetical protein [Chryseobacterium sp. Leaf180]KQR94549.1 hypothetical protein ASG01_01300 [Chryseobacterium sp. Leaf180]
MNAAAFFSIIAGVAILNVVTFYIFKRFLLGKSEAAMKFLVVNIFKDLVWIVASILILEKTKLHFFLLVLLFIISSLAIYFPVIRRINKS